MCPKVWVGNILQCNSVQKWGLLGSVEAQKTNLEAGQPLERTWVCFPEMTKQITMPLPPFLGNQTPCMAACMWCIDVDAGKTSIRIKLKQNGNRKSVNRYFRGPFVNRWKWTASIGLLQYHWWSRCPKHNAKARHCVLRLLENVLEENLIQASECVSTSALLIVNSVTLFLLEECKHLT